LKPKKKGKGKKEKKLMKERSRNGLPGRKRGGKRGRPIKFDKQSDLDYPLSNAKEKKKGRGIRRIKGEGRTSHVENFHQREKKRGRNSK